MRWVALVAGVVVIAAASVAAILLPPLRWPIAIVCGVIALGVAGWALYRVRVRVRAEAPEADPRPVRANAMLRSDLRGLLRGMRRRGAMGRATHERPWYALIGLRDTGKTTLLEDSGLPFTAIRGSGVGADEPRSQLGEWRACSDAVVLDASGDLAARGASVDGWRVALDELRRSRPGRPLDGVIVAVSVSDLLAEGDAAATGLAATLRELVEMAGRDLEMVLPVYVIVTKLDLLPGFADFWADLGAVKRSQMWGAALEGLGSSSPSVADAVKAEFDVLAERVYAYGLDRLASSGDAQRRGRAALFPVALHALRSPLARFVAALGQSSGRGDRPLLRGFYFTSATQRADLAGPPRLEANGGFGLPIPSARQPPSQARSYFVADVFRSVILPDRGCAVASEVGRARGDRAERRAAGAIVLAAATVLLPGAVSYRKNVELARRADAVAAELHAALAPVPGVRGDSAEALLDILEETETDAADVGIGGWFGPRAARALLPALGRAYIEGLHAFLRGRLGPRLEDELSGVSKAPRLDDATTIPEDRTPLRNAYDTVELAATLIEPSGHADTPRAADQLADAWAGTLNGMGAVSRDRLRIHAARYLRAVAGEPRLRWPSSLPFQRARSRVRDLGASQLPYHWALRRAYDEAPLVVGDLADAGSLKYLTCRAEQVLVRGQFTLAGWQRVRAVLDATEAWPPEARIEPWVLADSRVPEGEGALRQQVRARYYDDYASEWIALLDRCTVNQPRDVVSAREELTAMKGATGFYRTLFKAIGASAFGEPAPDPSLLTTLRSAAAAATSAAPDGGAAETGRSPSPVQRRLRPLLVFGGGVEDAGNPAPLDKYLSVLETLRTALESAGAPDAPDPMIQFLTAKRGVENLLDGVEEPLRGSLTRLLVPPVRGTMAIVETDQLDSVSAGWQRTVWSSWNSRFRDRFPFARARDNEAVDFEEFRAFFQPEGTLWSFVQSSMGGWVELDDRTYVAKAGAPPLSGDMLSCLSVARELTDAFFANGGEPGLTFAVQAEWSAADVTDAKLWIGDKATALPRSQWSAAIRWNGESARFEWVEHGRPTQVFGRHAFSLFDLFEQLGGLSWQGAGHGVYQVEASPLTLKVRAVGREDAMRPDFFRRLRCPQEMGTRTP